MKIKQENGIAELKQFWQGGEQPTWEITYKGLTAKIVDHDREYNSFDKRQQFADHIIKCLNSHDELIKALDIMARVFVYSSKGEFKAKEKIRATEMAVKALMEAGITSIGQTCDELLKED